MLSAFVCNAVIVTLFAQALRASVQDLHSYEGMTLKLTCPPESKEGVKWEKLDQSSSQWVDAVKGQTFVDRYARLIIENLQFSDRGLYRCTYKHEGYHYASKFNVSVRPSSVKAEVPHVTVYENETVLLKCFVFGGIDRVRWYHHETQLNWHSSRPVIISRGKLIRNLYLLEIPNINQSYSGTYKCRGHGVSGRDSNATITVTVKERPKIYHTGDVKTYRQVVGRNLSVPCQVSMTEFVNWTWNRNGVKVSHTETYWEGRTLHLVFNDLQKADQGQYTCVFKGVKYSDKLTVSIIVLDPPLAPRNVSLRFDCAWGFNVTWLSPVVSGGSDVLIADEYDYEILTVDARSTKPIIPVYNKTSTTNTFFVFNQKNICNFTVYYVRVRARNAKFRSSSPFVRIGLVSGKHCDSVSINCSALFPTTLPSIRITLITKCCKWCRDKKREITPRYLDVTLRQQFRNSKAVLQNLLPPTNNLSLQVTRDKRKIFLLEYQGYLNDSVSTVQLKAILSYLGQSFSMKSITLASCSYVYAFDCMLPFWRGVSRPCQELSQISNKKSKCSKLHPKIFMLDCAV